MKRSIRLALPITLALVALASCAGGCATTNRTVDERDIRAVLSAQQDAWNKGDIVAFMDGYDRAEDIVFTSGARVRRGFDATLAKYRQSYANDNAMGRLGFDILEVRFLGPDSALVLGRFELTETPKSGSGLFTLIFERRSAGWRCIHDHTSGERKPEEEPKK